MADTTRCHARINCACAGPHESDVCAVSPAKQPDTALYAYNFGDYRGELQGLRRGLEAFSDYDIDRFFFTDSESFGAVRGWTVVRLPKARDHNGIPGARVNTKRVKFQGHEVLAPYRYLIHMDTARRVLLMARRALNMGLLDYVRCHPEHALFVRAHLSHRSVQEEVEFLKAMPSRKGELLQPAAPLLAWDAFLQPQYGDLSAVRHPELCFWVRDTTHRRFGEQWARIHQVMLERGLWRDQIVYHWAMQNATAQVDFFDPWDNLAARCGESPGSAPAPPHSPRAPRSRPAANGHRRAASQRGRESHAAGLAVQARTRG